MTPEEWRRDEAERWISIANRDLHSARLLATEASSNSVFHTQQAAEKALKGFLSFHDTPFRKTHDLKELGAQCNAITPSLSTAIGPALSLEDYAVIFRYPDAPREPDEEEALKAILIAQRLVEEISQLLGLV